MADAAGGELDPTVGRLRLCVEQGRKIREEGAGFRLDGDLVVPKDTMCECPWVVKDPETKEMVLERASLATLVLLVQSPQTHTWSQYMQASKRARTPALSLWSFKSAQRFFTVGSTTSPAHAGRGRGGATTGGGGASSRAVLSVPRPHTPTLPSSISPQRLARKAGERSGSGSGAGLGTSRRRLFVGPEGDNAVVLDSGGGSGGGGAGGSELLVLVESCSGSGCGGAGGSDGGRMREDNHGGGTSSGADPLDSAAAGTAAAAAPAMTLAAAEGGSAAPTSSKLPDSILAAGTAYFAATASGSSTARTPKMAAVADTAGPAPAQKKSNPIGSALPAAGPTSVAAATKAAAKSGGATASGVPPPPPVPPPLPALLSPPPRPSPPPPPPRPVSAADGSASAAANKYNTEEVLSWLENDETSNFDSSSECSESAAASGSRELPESAGVAEEVSGSSPTGDAAEGSAGLMGGGSAAPGQSAGKASAHLTAEEAEAAAAAAAALAEAAGNGNGDVSGLVEMVGLPRVLASAKQGVTRIGSVVQTKAGHIGTVRFCGFTEFATGLWLGLELDEPYGKHDGSNKSKRYFKCSDQHGLFVRPSNVTLVSPASPAASAATAPIFFAEPLSLPFSAEAADVRPKAPVRVSPEAADAVAVEEDEAGTVNRRASTGEVGDGAGRVSASRKKIEPLGTTAGSCALSPRPPPPAPPCSPYPTATAAAAGPACFEVPPAREETPESDRTFARLLAAVKAGGKSKRKAGAKAEAGGGGGGADSGEGEDSGKECRGKKTRGTSSARETDSPVGEGMTLKESGSSAGGSKGGSSAVGSSTCMGSASSVSGSKSDRNASGSGSNTGLKDGCGGGSGRSDCDDVGPQVLVIAPQPELPEPLSPTSEQRPPLSEVTEDRRLSANSNTPPDLPLSPHRPPPAGVIATATTVAGGGGEKWLRKPRPLLPKEDDELESIRLLSPSTSPPTTRNVSGSPPNASGRRPGPGRGRPASTIPSPMSFSEKLAAAESASAAMAIVVAAAAAVASRGAAQAGTPPAAKVAATATEPAAAVTEREVDSIPAVTDAASAAVITMSPPIRTSSPGGARQRRQPPGKEDTLAAAATGVDFVGPTAAAAFSKAKPRKLVAEVDGGGRSGSGGGVRKRGGVPADDLSADTGITLEELACGKESGTGGGGTSPGSVEVPSSSSSSATASAGSSSRLELPTKGGAPVSRKKTKMAGDFGGAPVLGAADVALMKRGTVAAAVAAMESTFGPTKPAASDSKVTSSDSTAAAASTAAATAVTKESKYWKGSSVARATAAAVPKSDSPTAPAAFAVERNATALPSGAEINPAVAGPRRIAISALRQKGEASAGVSGSSPAPPCDDTDEGSRSRAEALDLSVLGSGAMGVDEVSEPAAQDSVAETSAGSPVGDKMVIHGTHRVTFQGHAGRYDETTEKQQEEEEPVPAELSPSRSVDEVGGNGGAGEGGGDGSTKGRGMRFAVCCLGVTASLAAALVLAAGAAGLTFTSGKPAHLATTPRKPVLAADGGGDGSGRRITPGRRDVFPLPGTPRDAYLATMVPHAARALQSGISGPSSGGSSSNSGSGQGGRDGERPLAPDDEEEECCSAKSSVGGSPPTAETAPAVEEGREALGEGAVGWRVKRRLTWEQAPEEIGADPDTKGREASLRLTETSPLLSPPEVIDAAERPLETSDGVDEAAAAGGLPESDTSSSIFSVGANSGVDSFLFAETREAVRARRGGQEIDLWGEGAGMEVVVSSAAVPTAAAAVSSRVSILAEIRALESISSVKMSPLDTLIESHDGVRRREPASLAPMTTSETTFDAPATPDGAVRPEAANASLERVRLPLTNVENGQADAAGRAGSDRSATAAAVAGEALEDNALDGGQPVSPLPMPWGAVSGNDGGDVVCLLRDELLIPRFSAWATKRPAKRRRHRRKLQPPQQEQKQQQLPRPRCSKVRAEPWRRNPNPAYRPPAAPATERPDSGTTEENQVAVEEPLPAFMRPGGGLVPVAFLTGCDAAAIAPDSVEKCESIPLLLGYTNKNVIELIEPGRAGNTIWRSRKSLVKAVKQSVGSKLSSWLRRKNAPGRNISGSGSIPPQAIAGLYLRETSDGRLAILNKSRFDSAANSDENGGGGGGGGPVGRDSVGTEQAQGADYGVLLEGRRAASGVEEEDGLSEEEGAPVGGGAGGGGASGGKGRGEGGKSSGRETNEGIEMLNISRDSRKEEDESRGERYAAMLTADGRLCVFGTRGEGVRCASAGVHRWVMHVAEGNAP